MILLQTLLFDKLWLRISFRIRRHNSNDIYCRYVLFGFTNKTTAPITISTDIIPNEVVDLNANVVTKEDANSNLNGVATAAVVNNDDIDNVKSPPECNNLIGDSNGIKDK